MVLPLVGAIYDLFLPPRPLWVDPPVVINLIWITMIVGSAILTVALAVAFYMLFNRRMLAVWRFDPFSSEYYGLADILYTVSLGFLATGVASAIANHADGRIALHNGIVLAIIGIANLGATIAAQLLLQRYVVGK